MMMMAMVVCLSSGILFPVCDSQARHQPVLHPFFSRRPCSGVIQSCNDDDGDDDDDV